MEPKSPELQEVPSLDFFSASDGTKISIETEPPNKSGSEKTVYKGLLGDQELAIKIINPKVAHLETGNDIELTPDQIKERAEKEFADHQKLIDTPLAPYIPKPHFLVKDINGNTVGMAVDWIEGDSFNSYVTKPLTLDEVDELEKVFLSFVGNENIKPDPEMMESANMLITDEEPAIKIAECALDDGFWKENPYADYVKKQMNDLRRAYAK